MLQWQLLPVPTYDYLNDSVNISHTFRLHKHSMATIDQPRLVSSAQPPLSSSSSVSLHRGWPSAVSDALYGPQDPPQTDLQTGRGNIHCHVNVFMSGASQHTLPQWHLAALSLQHRQVCAGDTTNIPPFVCCVLQHLVSEVGYLFWCLPLYCICSWKYPPSWKNITLK